VRPDRACALGGDQIGLVELGLVTAGLIGMALAGLMLFVRVRGGSGGVLYLLAAVVIGAVLISEMVPPEAFERLSNLPGLHGDTDGGSAEGEGSLQRGVKRALTGFVYDVDHRQEEYTGSVIAEIRHHLQTRGAA